MIGGYDKTFTKWSNYHGEYIKYISMQLKHLWPTMIIQDANAIEPFDESQKVPYYSLYEVFFYKDYESYSSWMQLGADESNENTMIHVIEDRQTLTLVFDDPRDKVTSQIIKAVSQFNRDYQAQLPTALAA